MLIGVAVACGGCTGTPSRLQEADVDKTVRLQVQTLMRKNLDALDFNKPDDIENPEILEQHFADFIGVFPLADKVDIERGIDSMLLKAKVSEAALDKIAGLAEKYLYDANSPMRDNEYYIIFLERCLKSGYFDDDDCERMEYRLEMARKNRLGTRAADFSYVDRNGRTHTLHSTAAPGELLLIFYSPDCESCKETLSKMKVDNEVMRRVASGSLTVLLIDAEDDYDKWSESVDSLPDTWIVGHDISDIIENDLYDIPATPTVYLLDRNKRVIKR